MILIADHLSSSSHQGSKGTPSRMYYGTSAHHENNPIGWALIIVAVIISAISAYTRYIMYGAYFGGIDFVALFLGPKIMSIIYFVCTLIMVSRIDRGNQAKTTSE